MVAKLIHVEGNKKAKIILYALSTCQWCSKTKNLLNDLGLEYYYGDVDLAEVKDKNEMIKEIKKCNPSVSFPTMLVDDKDCIVGFDEDKIKEMFS